MKLFDNKLEIIRIDDIFPMFLRESRMRYRLTKFTILEKDFSDELFGGWGNGYVGLPNWHPFYKMSYDKIPVNIHNGLTFNGHDKDEDLWVIGFDTDHWGDDIIKWSFENVKEETKLLLKQCVEIEEVQRTLRILKLNKLKNIK